MPSELLSIQPGELKFPFELKKQISSSLRLVNSSENNVAFKVKTTNPKKYCVRPNTGVVQPNSSQDVTVTMQAQRETPPDMQCKDKFLVQSVVAPPGSSTKEVSQDLFNKELGNEIHEAKLKVLYVSPPQPPSPITESNEEEEDKVGPVVDNGDRHFPPNEPTTEAHTDTLMSSLQQTAKAYTDSLMSPLQQTSKDVNEYKFKLNEVRAALSSMTDERNQAVQQTRTMQQELQAMKNGSKLGGAQALKTNQKLQSGFSFLFVILVGLLGMLVGYLLGG